MHVALLVTILVVMYTRSVLKGIRISYTEWTQIEISRNRKPVSQELG